MSSDKRRTANRRNAEKSTGPKTPAGRAKVAGNALAHSLDSARTVLPGESAAAWDQHRAGVMTSLAPVGELEVALADRVAACLWRLRRVVAYETAVTVADLEEAAEPVPREDEDRTFDAGRADRQRMRELENRMTDLFGVLTAWSSAAELFEQLPSLPDGTGLDGDAVEGVFEDMAGNLSDHDGPAFDITSAEFLAGLDVPAAARDDPFHWDGWTAGLVRRAVAVMAAAGNVDADDLLTRAGESRRQWVRDQREQIARLETAALEVEARLTARRDRQILRAAIPAAATLDRITRYEAHLSRQITHALHTLERLQAARAGQPVLPPVAIDVVVDVPPPTG
ncbi:hypothetical protein [Fimbriiglobus ruber]|uniref:Uncharacterized protein n=1 Tax=Fimbriiglobus ruber TaxID=1908690 RepID=A0A225CXT4_9BACT|nr:hypothetical protein [Fimbriiglobus ruber]OWK34180.1 hypothetical protein FRUB_10151 [Fimbriiglobus ruber]